MQKLSQNVKDELAGKVYDAVIAILAEAGVADDAIQGISYATQLAFEDSCKDANI